METRTVACTCGHTGEKHAIHNSPFNGACVAAGCKCQNFKCPECGETYGLHTALCRHMPRVPWATPSGG